MAGVVSCAQPGLSQDHIHGHSRINEFRVTFMAGDSGLDGIATMHRIESKGRS